MFLCCFNFNTQFVWKRFWCFLYVFTFKVSRGDSFFVPPHNTYNLLNLSSTQVQSNPSTYGITVLHPSEMQFFLLILLSNHLISKFVKMLVQGSEPKLIPPNLKLIFTKRNFKKNMKLISGRALPCAVSPPGRPCIEKRTLPAKYL